MSPLPRPLPRSRRAARATALVAAAALGALSLTACGSRLEREEILAGGSGSVASTAGGAETVAQGAVGDAAAAVDAVAPGVDGGAAVPAGAAAADPAAGADASTAGSTSGATGAAATSGGAAGAAADSAAAGGTTGGTTGAAAPDGPTSGSAASAPGGTTGGSTGGTTGAEAASADLTGPGAAIFGGGTCMPADKSIVNLGNVSTLSGVLGQLFSPIVPALQAFTKSQNECGGLNGHKINLIIGDDQGDPSTARNVANRQIANDKIIAMLGNIQPLTIDALVTVVNKAKVPVIGGDITNNTWFTNPYLFPQGPPPQATSFLMVTGTKDTFRKKKLAHVYCLEVPQACRQIDIGIQELAKGQGVDLVASIRVSITSPSYQSQCAQMQKAGAEVVAMSFDAASMVRLANDCAKIGFKPKYEAYSLGVANEDQFLGNPSLGETLVPLNVFGWTADATPAEKYYQRAYDKHTPGATRGNGASLGWVAGMLAVAASTELGDTPTKEQFAEGLWKIKNNDLAGTTAPLTFTKGKNYKIDYCTFTVQSNAKNSGWNTPTSKAVCTKLRSKSDPNQ